MRHLSLFIFLFLYSAVQCQTVQHRALNHNSENLWILEERKPKINTVFSAESVVYYGIDFSRFVFMDASKIGNEKESMVTFIRKWQNSFEKKCLGGEDKISLRKALGKEIIENEEEVQKRYIGRDDPWIDSLRLILHGDSLQAIVKAYGRTDEQVGLSIIVECFDPIFKRVVANYIFFNPHTGDILWYMKIQSPAVNLSSWKSWSNALNSTFFRFRKMYLDRRRNSK